MKFDYVGPFVDATVQVLRTVLGAEVRSGEIGLLQAPLLNGDISVVIAIKDDRGETIILNMETGTALGICEALNRTAFEAVNDLGYDTLGEVANMIAGTAVSTLTNRGFDFQVHPPEAVDGERILRITEGLELFQVPVRCAFGDVTVNFAARTN